MRQMGIWFWLSIKRWLLHPGFAALLILIPVLMAGIRSLEPEKTEKITIGVWAEGDGLGQETAQELSTRDGMFQFVLYASEDEAIEAVETREAECAYLFPADLQERLAGGDYRRCIAVCTAPSTILEPLTGEIVFAALASRYDGVLLEEYAEQEEAFGELDETGREQHRELYEKYRTDGSTFRFEYASLDEYTGKPGTGMGAETGQSGDGVFPVRGLTAVFVFLAAFFAACSTGQDEQRGLFAPLPAAVRPLCRWAALAAPVALAALSSLAALRAAGEWTETFFELGAMAAYALISALCGEIAARIVRKPQVLAALIPFMALALLVICPVFFDAGRWIGEVSAVRRVLPPAWYLSWF